MDSASLTPAQRAVAAALLFLGSAVLAGVTLVADGVAYRTFGLVEGIFALLLSYVLVHRGAWTPPVGVAGWIAVAYGTLAGAQVLELLFPPPGVIEWAVVGTLSIAAWSALGRGSRERLVVSLASLALILAVLKFSLIPAVWSSTGPAAGTAFGLGDLAERGRRFLADGQPVRPVGQLVGFVALCLWCLGIRLLWPTPAATARVLERSRAPGDSGDA
jgi:hypothetical protein